MYVIDKINTAEQTFTVHCPVCDETTNGGNTGTLPTMLVDFYVDNCDQKASIWEPEIPCPACGHEIDHDQLIDDALEEVWNATFDDFMASEEARAEAYAESLAYGTEFKR